MPCIEFHCHTLYSPDSASKLDGVLETCREKGIDRIVITDHNTIAGALQAQLLDPERVIVGEEVMTTHGELLAAFIQEEIPPGLTPFEAIERLRLQGAFISVSHPFDAHRSPWNPELLREILPYLDAIETFNARCVWPGYNWNAQAFAQRHSLPGTSGSDAHTLAEIGAARMELEPFTDASSLRQVIRQARYHNRLSPPWVHMASRLAKKQKQ